MYFHRRGAETQRKPPASLRLRGKKNVSLITKSKIDTDNKSSYMLPFRKLILFLVFAALIHSSNAQVYRPNILWIVCEDISPFIGAYGATELKTPNIDRLAKEGIRYTHAYSVSGVCAPSRSAIITGMYPTSIGTQHMRTAGDPKYQPVPSYSAVIPDYVKCFPEILRQSGGYYCTNNFKQDYQFTPPVTVWDENGPAASYRNRRPGQPFFAVYNLAITHESMLFPSKDSLLVDPDKLTVPPIYPDTKTVRSDIARLYTNIKLMDKQVGEILEQLKKDSLYDNTIIFFYSDHGGALPWMKREVLERGTHIPLIIRFPSRYKSQDTVSNKLISTIDFAPTVLNLARIPLPSYLQGQPFIKFNSNTAYTDRSYVFAARDRMDTEYDRVRMVRDLRFRYCINYQLDKPYYQEIEFRRGIPMMAEILKLKEEGKLGSVPMMWFNKKPKEELYDVEKDPYELQNLANHPLYKDKLLELRGAYEEWITAYGDKSEMSEKEMLQKMWNNQTAAPATAIPTVYVTKKGVHIECSTKGASIGYRIVNAATTNKTHIIQSWDFGFQKGSNQNGKSIPAAPVWNIYEKGNSIAVNPGDTLKINAMRIGYTPAVVDVVDGKVVGKE